MAGSFLVAQQTPAAVPHVQLMVATVAGAIGLWWLLPRGGSAFRWLGAILGLVSLVLFARCLPGLGGGLEQAGFWILAGLTVAAAVATVSAVNPVYSAIWFAMALLTTAGLMLYSGAQFLGVATVVVYAGAIVVTFLFVLMLARPQGQSFYDRISWGRMPVMFAALSAAAVVGVSVASIAKISSTREALPPKSAPREIVLSVLPKFVDAGGRQLLDEQQIRAVRLTQDVNGNAVFRLDLAGEQATRAALQSRQLQLQRLIAASLAPSRITAFRLEVRWQDLQSEQHVASLGSQLFTRHLISVQVAGTLLLAALVGAVAIAGQGPRRRARTVGEPS